MVIQLTQIYFRPANERKAKYRSENPEEAKILEEYEEKMFKTETSKEIIQVFNSTCEKLGRITEIELDRKLIKLYGEEDGDIKDFEKLWGVKYQRQY